ncbi:MAG: TetR/AcrR family transcriptional regulator [Candidatus Cloacimonetes bacterium]|nr:TetR/AcrR family transcriptional regulator [Candidatus Cloacimonadota bacterium]
MEKSLKSIAELNKKQFSKRQAIIKAGIEIITEKGFHCTKISDIARKANVADGTVYLYFKSKDDLMIKSFDYLMTAKLQSMKEMVRDIENPLERLQKFFALHVKMFSSNPHIVRYITIELYQCPEFSKEKEIRTMLHEHFNYIKQLYDEAIEQKLIKPINTKVLIHIIIGHTEQMLREWIHSDRSFSLAERAEDFAEILRYGTRF